MKKIRPYLVPLLLFFLSVLLRISLISRGPYNIDCLNLALLAEKSIQTHQLHYLFGSGYPLTIILSIFFITIAKFFSVNDPVTAVNFMSVFFGSLCVPVFYLLVKKLFNASVALLSAISLSICPLFLGISTYGMSHAPSLFFFLSGIFFLLIYTTTYQKTNLIISGIFIGFMGATRLQEMLLMATPICFIYFIPPEKPQKKITNSKILTNFILLSTLIISTTIIFYLPYILGPDRTNYLNQWSSYQQSSLSETFLPLAISGNFKFLAITLSPIGFIISILGLLSMIKTHYKIFLFCLLWISIPLLLYSRLYTDSPRFLTILLPPLLMSQGFLLSKLIKINRIFRIITFTTYSLILFLTFNTIYPLLSFRHKYTLLPDYARWIAQKTEKNANIIVADDSLFIRYYGNRKTFGRPLKTLDFSKAELQKFQKNLDNLLNKDIPIYITYIGLYDYDPGKKFSNLIEKNYDLKIIGTHLYEDWHSGEMARRVFYNPLVKIQKK